MKSTAALAACEENALHVKSLGQKSGGFMAAVNLARNDDCFYNCTPKNFLVCIPIFGEALSYFEESTLMDQIRTERRPDRLIQLIQTKNDYKVARMISRVVLSLAVTVYVISMGILFANAAIPVYLAFLWAVITGIAIDGDAIDRNDEVIREIARPRQQEEGEPLFRQVY